MIEGVGDTAIVDLIEPLPADIAQAKAMLLRVSEEVQLKGWHFNKECAYPLLPDNKAEIPVPIDVHRVSFHEPNAGRYILRDHRLYDVSNKTYRIGISLKADVTKVLDYEKLPLTFRHYIATRAARKYQNTVLGSDTIRNIQEQDELEARLACLKEEQELLAPAITKGYAKTMLGGWSVADTLRR